MCATQRYAGSMLAVLFVVFFPPSFCQFTNPATTPPPRVFGSPFGSSERGDQLKKNAVFLDKGVPHHGTKPVKESIDQGVVPDLTYDVHTVLEDRTSPPDDEDELIEFESRGTGLGVLKKHHTKADTTTNSPSTQQPVANRRKKRGITIDDETKFWTNGIVPYVFSSELSDTDKLAIFYAMEFVSNMTCIRFVPWDSTTKDKYGLANAGHLRFINGDGCWSNLGNHFAYFGDDGQAISCCYASVCVHELGHALGLRHEHAHYDNKGWLRRNWFNQTSDWLHAYAERQFGSSHRFTPYDLSSPMHYPIYSSSTETTLLFPDMEIQVKYHYFAKLISDTYHCQERNCSSFSTQCQNNGFVTLTKGQCSCVCPDGLDPATGCTTQRTKSVAQTFPGGNYAILAPSEGCPSANGFESGVITHTYPFGRVISPNKLLGTISNGVASTQFCVKQSQYENAAHWPRGDYCIYKVGSCPAGFYESTITIGTNSNGNSETGTTPDADLNANDVKFYYCCRRDGIISEPVDFANTKPFVLVEQSAWGCQQIKGLGVYENYYTLIDPKTSNAYTVTNNGPRIYRSVSSGETYFYYCYYYPISDNSFPIPACVDSAGSCPSQADSGQCDDPAVQSSCPYSCNKCPGPQGGSGTCMDTDSTCDPASCGSYSTAQLQGCKFTCRQCPEFCGGVITLTDTDRSRTITSPNYPLNYGNNMDCLWEIKGPENSAMLVKFQDFDVEGTSNSCKDKLEINNALMGHEGLNYCGQDMFMTIRSITNVIEMRLQTDFQNARRGFNATVSLVMPDDHCYDQGGFGQNYRGAVGYTRDFKTCLPWDEVKHCRHSAYTPVDLLDGLDKNYCRNPGDGLRPWCYYDATDCKRNYCDVCGLDTPYDTVSDCDAFKTAGSCVNEAEARAKCARTCQDELPAAQTQAHTDIQCTSPPTSPPDGTPTTTLQGPYNLGDTVTFTCSDTPSFSRLTTCLSDGSWSPIGYACGGCPDGWTYHRGYCYKEQQEYMTYANAQARCQSLGADMVEPRDEATMRFLILFKDDGHSQWMGLERVESQGYRWQDGTKPAWSKWQESAAASKDCSMLRPDVYWTTADCYSKALFVCRLPAEVPSTCADLLSDCASKIADDPTVCDDQPDFAKLLCPKSCYGDCNDPCSTSPCQNGGTCQVESGSYTCVCTVSHEGTNCETEIVDDASTGSCEDTNQYCDFSASQGGCSGSKKHYVLSVCQKSCAFCDYNASACVDTNTACDGEGCVDRLTNCFQLAADGECSTASVSAHCPHACSLCFNPMCPDHNEYCNGWASSGECNRNPAYMHGNCPYSCGKCADYNKCYGNPCQNGGNCSQDSSTATGYLCTCAGDYTGDRCEATAGGPCEASPCQNGATCNEAAETYNCDCVYGFVGTNCENADPCVPDPCKNGGTCTDNAQGTFTCSCASGFAGDTCQETVCVDKNGYCNVWANWSPSECETNSGYMNSNCAVSCGTCATLNPCWGDPQPCQNGGTCTKDGSDAQGYTCACPSGFLGHDCDVVNDPCDPNPCQNAGTCDAGVCDCTGTGFTGATCADPEPAATCAAGWTESNSACYKFVDVKAKFADAEAVCAQDMDSVLTPIQSKEERDFVRTLAATTIWIGGDKRNSADYVWADGTAVTGGYQSWKTGEPDGAAGTLPDINCMTMSKGGKWMDFTCSKRKKPYVCKYLLA
ncbi:uncharacterized protein [Littorina saxatilis]|uniref:uncharacterized protein n=1 Tax=Littorina saxatilis TaxID=31220 RepID=UPI0038B4BE07